MSRHFFLSDIYANPEIVPSERWRSAFPGGLELKWDDLLKSLSDGDVVWVPVMHWAWRDKVREIVRRNPFSHVVVVSFSVSEEEGLSALGEGAKGYCHLLSVPILFKEVAEVVLHHGYWIGENLVQRLLHSTKNLLSTKGAGGASIAGKNLGVLSDREFQVAQEVAKGKSNKEIGGMLNISERTVKAHLGSIFQKLEVRDRVQLVLALQDASRSEKAP